MSAADEHKTSCSQPPASAATGTTTQKVFSSPCLLGEEHPDINPDYFGTAKENHVQILASNTILYCKHWRATVDFYQHTMKFSISFQKDEWFIEFRAMEGSHLSIADEARCTIPAGSGKGVTLSYRVARLADTHRYFVAAGQNPTPIKSHSWRAPYFFVYDPEGNRIELWNETVDE